MHTEEIAKLIEQGLQRGLDFLSAGQSGNAEEICRQILRLDPDYADAMRLLAICCKQNGNLEDAMSFAKKSLDIKEDAEIWNIVGLIHGAKWQYNEAIECYRKAIKLDPSQAIFYSNLTIALKDAGEWEEAKNVYTYAFLIHDDKMLFFNYGSFLHEQGKIDEAIEYYQKAIALDPELAVAHFNLATAYLLQGKYALGWAEYEWRWKYHKHHASLRNRFTQPEWDGNECDTLLLYNEQGAGDLIMFARYFEMIKYVANKLIVECSPELVSLVEEMGVADMVIPYGKQIAFDKHMSVMGLGKMLCNPPIQYDQYLSDKPKTEMTIYKDKTKVGIAWCGSLSHPNDKNRSFPVSYFAPLADKVQLFSLHNQYLSRPNVNLHETNGMKLVDLSNHLHDFADTAEVIRHMDLVITADTGVAHIAGAMGKPVWILLPKAPDWRWGMERDKCVWYQSAKLYRQDKAGDWDSVFEKVYQDFETAFAPKSSK